MSFLLMARAIKADIPDCYAKWLMVVLADHANEDTHECWPSLARLSDRTQMSVPTITRKLNWLEEQGLVTRVRGSNQRSTLYTIFPIAESNTTVAHRNTTVAERNTNLSTKLSTKKKKAVPEDWLPSEELKQSIDLKLQENQDHEYETNQFCCHHASKGSTFVNIDLAYRGWCYRAFNWRADRAGSGKATGTGKSTRGRQKASHFAGIAHGLSSKRNKQDEVH